MLISGAAAELKILDNTNFDDQIKQGNVLVKFFAPWCGFCKKMADGYKRAADELEGVTSGVVAEIDCDQAHNKEIMERFGVRGFPTLLWFDADGIHHEYDSGRDEESVKKWVLEHSAPATWYSKYFSMAKSMGKKTVSAIEDGAEEVYRRLPSVDEAFNVFASAPEGDWGNTDLLTLNPSNLEETIARGNVLVKFFAPWCGHCKNMKEDYEQVAQKVHAEIKAATIAEFDCTQEGAQALAQKYAAEGFPTVMWFPASGSAWEYLNGRDQESFMNFVRANAKGANPLAPLKEHALAFAKQANDYGLQIREVAEDVYAQAKAIALQEKTAIIGTGANLANIVGKKNALIKFAAPWCGFCKKIKPEYEKAAVQLHSKFPDVQIVDFDCEEPSLGRVKCAEWKIQGYPTLKWIDNNGDISDYDGGRDENAIIDWVTKKMENPAAPKVVEEVVEEVKQVIKQVKEITEEEANKIYTAANWELPKNTFVKFFAPWCGFCKRMKDDWISAGKRVLNEIPGAQLAELDCTGEGADAVSKQFNVSGFPTIMWFDENGKHTEYEGGRSIDDIVNHVKAQMKEVNEEL